MSKVNIETLNKRNCLARWFSPLTPGSMRGCILSLIQTSVGAGILSLPYVFKSSGLILGAFLLTFGAVMGL